MVRDPSPSARRAPAGTDNNSPTKRGQLGATSNRLYRILDDLPDPSCPLPPLDRLRLTAVKRPDDSGWFGAMKDSPEPVLLESTRRALDLSRTGIIQDYLNQFFAVGALLDILDVKDAAPEQWVQRLLPHIGSLQGYSRFVQHSLGHSPFSDISVSADQILALSLVDHTEFDRIISSIRDIWQDQKVEVGSSSFNSRSSSTRTLLRQAQLLIHGDRN